MMLGLTAGFVNAAGFLGFAVLTTNVTGHAALFAERVALQDWKTAKVVALWMVLFFAGAFISSLIVSMAKKSQRSSYVIPVIVEILILATTALYGNLYQGNLLIKELFAGSLLFAMGMQNSLVSIISGSVVRTTHLTGTFTDLGIELAQWVSNKKMEHNDLRSRIKLRLYIICSFMAGAISGAYLFRLWRFHSFFIPACLLCLALIYDVLRVKVKHYYHVKSAAFKKAIHPAG
ncbi:YoaK family protein [Mucilaginibacter sp.]|uniref:YoaK family protein n=1 Tax=Mucilaginibacter sp. TaxID=1882438 RepID=UPI003266ECD2